MMADTQLHTYQEYKPDDQARRQIGTVVFHDRHGDEELLVPTRVNPDLAKEFLDQHVGAGLKWEPLWRCADLTRFYVQTEVLPNFEKLLNKSARSPEDLLKTVECIRLLGDLGSDAQRESAVPFFEYALDHESAGQVMNHVLQCVFHLSDLLRREDVDARLQKRIQSAERGPRRRTRDTDPAELQAQRTLALPILFNAGAERVRILQEADDLRRATELARTYLGVTDVGGIDWPTWAAFAIMGEVQRSSDANVVAGLQAALEEIPEGEDERFVRQARARSARAIGFFGGSLTRQQMDWLAFGTVRRFQLEG